MFSYLKFKLDTNSKTLFLLIVAPIFTTCAICITTFVILHNWHHSNLNNASYNLLAKYFKEQFIDLKSQLPDANWFNKQANIVISTGMYAQLILIDENQIVVQSVGLPIHDNDLNSQWVTDSKNDHLAHKNHTHLNIELRHSSGSKYRIIALINDAPTTLLFYQTLLWGVLCTFVLAILVTWLAVRCHKHLITPIYRLTAELKKGINENFDVLLTTSNNDIYANLIHVSQQILNMNRGLKEGTQLYIEQATQELRETLETVEIQNIELDIARKNALQASADKSELLATTSHEIRTPLNGILGFTNLLIKTELSDQQKDYLSTIEQSAQGLLTVINDVIDYARLESGTMTFEYKPVKVREMVSEILQVYAPSANESHLRLIQLIDPAIPYTLLGDPLRLKQVLNNIIHCLIAIESTGDLIVECVSQHKADSKMGIQFSLKNPTAQLSHLQQTQLQQALISQGSLPIGDATGLGLTIARALAERMQGRIAVDFSGDGIKFVFNIELGQTSTQLDPSNNLDTSSIRAVVCDANPFSRQEIVIELKKWEIIPSIENNPDKLLLAISAARANLLILDFALDGKRFNKSRIEKHLEELYPLPMLHIAVIAPSNIRRQIEKSSHWHDIHFITRPIIGNAFSQLLRRISGIPDNIESNIEKQRLKILVADDNPANLKLVCAFLQQDNHSIATVANGKQAVDSFIEDKPDIIFMDVQMPEMDGLEATKDIRKYELEHTMTRVPIVALTANALPEQRAKILMSGMDDYLTKPVSDHDLKHALYRWIETRQTPLKVKFNQIDLPLKSDHTTTEISITKQTPSNTPPISTEIFDRRKSIELTRGNLALAKDMFDMLVNELDEYKITISNAHQNQDFTSLLEAVHKFRGGVVYSGFIALKNDCEVTDDMLTDAKAITSDISRSIEKLIDSIEIAIDFCGQIDSEALFAAE